MQAKRLQNPLSGLPFRTATDKQITPQHCARFEKDKAWRPKHADYPWSSAVFKGAGGVGGVPPARSVLYGTAFAQHKIYQHQHPANCSAARFLVYKFGTWPGMGSHVHIAGQALALALELKRVLIWMPDHEQFPFRDEKRCPGDYTWDCWWQPITHCPSPGPDADVLVKEVIDDLNVNLSLPYTSWGQHYEFCENSPAVSLQHSF